ncbi:hypothetical protein VKT23_015714 [Stygiomarasmius scandens]|uniref:Heterokaryon incompatibility domain-containing protein n=1 Tax=Marasmiellus scandens TaxID=2682957 RepID=A0ABR1IZK0_9AGAR
MSRYNVFSFGPYESPATVSSSSLQSPTALCDLSDIFHHNAIFPCSALSDEEVKPFFSRDAVVPYRSHRCVQVTTESMIVIKNPASPRLMMPIDVCPRRLLDTRTLQLVEFYEEDIVPPYAILSHRWIEGKEVVYEEFCQHQHRTKLKSGYQKIEAACRQARQDGIQYIWIDTCCIKQENHADVRKNIVSVYAYYQNADVCYAYLADTTTEYQMFRSTCSSRSGSEWFQRAWTLQELIAPRTVIFFGGEWQHIGDKHKLRGDIYRLTTIPPAVLSSEMAIQDVDMLTRMSWATQRVATRRQDEAYCLQGLLGILVEPNYEEYWMTSFNRLGKTLFDAHPELRAKLGMSDNFNYNKLYILLWKKLNDAQSQAKYHKDSIFLRREEHIYRIRAETDQYEQQNYRPGTRKGSEFSYHLGP